MNQKQTEIMIGKSLRVGVIASVLITLCGGILYLFQHQGLATQYAPAPDETDAHFAGAQPYLRGISTVVAHILQLDGAAIVQLGVIVLIATPLLRIVLSLAAFIIEKDKLYALIAAIVLTIILSNMFFSG
ncbi:MAG: DUF1634 domain-containing protein [Prevotellaceae bacterium]|jgi:uncharacterized membrane protein|nr:DUF1634 domain-containing protein [Prevotellaceae bacterium]